MIHTKIRNRSLAAILTAAVAGVLLSGCTNTQPNAQSNLNSNAGAMATTSTMPTPRQPPVQAPLWRVNPSVTAPPLSLPFSRLGTRHRLPSLRWFFVREDGHGSQSLL